MDDLPAFQVPQIFTFYSLSLCMCLSIPPQEQPMCWLGLCQLMQARVILEEGNSTEKMPPPQDWPIDKHFGTSS